ncbi:acyl-CoA dehydrogenase family protein [Amaricoccus solimangrovi]|uniref:Acyl-CoA dehydrogenase n=1 Tax=Amaricoccus solimangrovi TaxID=2589815 RepID=A0A501WF52_9RHOB|nr:acyl-CoA dehydrogenase family protein [Amaricoccus solimangrovi]TPE48199.1 acyl-CoA dehydrogenase [Amaricoccus solimangrovi]
MIAFQAPVEDILFALDLAGAGRLPDWDQDLAREVLVQFARFAEGEIAPLDEPGDREGCRLEGGRVIMPGGFAAAWAALVEQGWHTIGLPEQWGGQGLPGPLLGAVSEIFAGANHSLQMVTALVPGAARTILAFGTEEQKARWLPRLASGEWLATMAITEPGAGSDLSGLRTRAERAGDLWRIEGEKIFISGGDHDLSPRVLHLVLARTGAAAEGTRGLSLFLVPSHDAEGVRAPVRVTRIEEKMGLHASPTCQLAFEGAGAELLGHEGGGLGAMFTMMNHARLDVALQGVAHAARASHVARSYAAERRQGGGPIAGHPDVARMLDTAEAGALGARLLALTAQVELAEKGDTPLVDFLTPVCKVLGTEAGIAAADLAIQVLGGYGYLREYRVEQTWRDARITAIYEGANGIHARALATRGLTQGGGAAADAFETLMARAPEIAGPLALWRDARRRVAASDRPEALAHAFMKLTGAVALGFAWARLGAAAERAPDPARLARIAARVRAETEAGAACWGALCAAEPEAG